MLLQNVGRCSSEMNVQSTEQIYETLKSLGVLLTSKYLATFLYLFQNSSPTSGYANEVGRYHSLLHPPAEKMTALMIKNAVVSHDIPLAMEHLNSLSERQGSDVLRLRTLQVRTLYIHVTSFRFSALIKILITRSLPRLLAYIFRTYRSQSLER